MAANMGHIQDGCSHVKLDPSSTGRMDQINIFRDSFLPAIPVPGKALIFLPSFTHYSAAYQIFTANPPYLPWLCLMMKGISDMIFKKLFKKTSSRTEY